MNPSSPATSSGSCTAHTNQPLQLRDGWQTCFPRNGKIGKTWLTEDRFIPQICAAVGTCRRDNCRNISLALRIPEKGEWKAQSGENTRSCQRYTLDRVSKGEDRHNAPKLARAYRGALHSHSSTFHSIRRDWDDIDHLAL